MPDMGTIATVLTVNAAPAQAGFSVYKAELASAQRATQSMSRNSSFAILELGRFAEDAAVGFGTNGLAGAVRGGLNNLTSFATIVGGPVAGAIAGLTAAGVSLLTTFFKPAQSETKKAEDAAKSYREELERLKDVADRGFALQGLLQGPRGGIDDELIGGADRGAIERAIKDREQQRAQGRDREALLRQRAQQIAFQIPAAEGGQKAGLQGQLKAADAEVDKIVRRERELLRELRQLRQRNDELRAQEEFQRGEEAQRQALEWQQELDEAARAAEQRRIQERAAAFFARPMGWKNIDFDLGRGEGRGLPGFGAPQRGTVAAQSAILRAGQNRDKGVSEQQLAKLKDIDRKLNDFLKKNALGLGVIALP